MIHDKYSYVHKRDLAKSERYYSNLDYLIDYPIKNWYCGHSHCVLTKEINGVNMGINSVVSQNTEDINLNFIEL